MVSQLKSKAIKLENDVQRSHKQSEWLSQCLVNERLIYIYDDA